MLIPLLLALVRLSSLFGGLSSVEASNSAVAGKALILHLESCPNITPFLRQSEGQGAKACYLCYCKDGGVAECWIRDSWRCEVENKQRSKRESRVKRSPVGFGALFFRDAARDLFNLREPEQCQPFSESYSEGCPPVDWCIGCTICDCDANGRWDCRLLSFCDDEEGKKSMKKRYKGDLRRRGQRTRTTTKTTTPSAEPTKRHNKKWFKMTKKHIEHNVTKPTLMPKLKERDLTHGSGSVVLRKNITKNALMLNHKTKPLIKSGFSKSNNSVIYAKNLVRTLLGTVNKIIVKSIEDQSKQMQAKQNKQAISATNKENVNTLVENNKDNSKVNAKNENTYRAKAKKGFIKKVVKRKAISKNVIKMQDKENLHRNKRSVSEDNMTNNFTKATYEAGTPDHTEVTKVVNYDLLSPINANFYPINGIYITDKDAYAIDTINQFNKTHVISNEAIGSLEFKHDNQMTSKNLKEHQRDFNTISIKSKMKPSNKDLLMGSILDEVDFSKANSYEHKVKNLQSIRDKNVKHLNATYMNYVKETNGTTEKERLTTVSGVNNLISNKWERLKNLDERVDNLLLKITKSEKDVLVKHENFDNFTFTTRNKTETTHNINENRSNKIGHISPRAIILKNNSLNFKVIPNSNETEYLQINNNTQNKVDSWIKKWYKGYKTKKNSAYTPKKKKFYFLKYFRNLFGRIFALNKKKQPNVHKRSDMLNILCKNNCLINLMPHLQSKVKELYNEANKILRILKILKGLLRVLDFDLEGKPLKKNETGVSNFMNDDIQKLNAVLKGKYDNNINKLSDSQIRQVEYIKNNTHEFIKSMEAFSCILSNIIRTLKTHFDEDFDGDIKTVSKKHARATRGFKKSQTMEQSLAKFQNLISTYNLAQNNFLKRLQEAVQSLENKYPRKIETKRNFIPKVSLTNNQENYTASIEMFTKNIIENLRRLRNLAMKMNHNDRRKRETMYYDGTVEYLLAIMEYLLKNYPFQKQVDSVHDGIDLLLHVISNAPDIKIIQHIHSQNQSLNILRRMLVTTEATSPLNPLTTNNFDDISSTEITKKDNNISTVIKHEIESSQQFSNDDDNDNLMENDKSNAKNNIIKSETEQDSDLKFNNTDAPYTVTEIPKNIRNIYKYVDNNETSVENVFERSLQSRLSDAVQNETTSLQTEIKEEKEIYVDPKQKNEENNEKKDYYVYAAEVEEEQEEDVPITTTEASLQRDLDFSTTIATLPPLSPFISEAHITKFKPLRAKYYLPDLEDISGNEKGLEKDKNNWLDEVYENEFKEYLLTNDSKSVLTTTQTTAVTDEQKSDLDEESYSTRARKMKIEKEPEKKTIEIIMKKKQLDLLDSLDYVTEKTEVIHLHDGENPGDGFPNFLSS